MTPTVLDDYADRGREVLRALALVLDPNRCSDIRDPNEVSEILFPALVSLIHVCLASEVDFDAELLLARDLVRGDLDEDAAMQREGA